MKKELSVKDMPEPQFTGKGEPWVIFDDGQGTNILFFNDGLRGLDFVARIHDKTKDHPDVALMATAPELYCTLEGLAYELEDVLKETHHPSGESDYLQIVLKVLAKARGER